MLPPGLGAKQAQASSRVVAALFDIAYGLGHDRLAAYPAAWVASLKLASREPLGKPHKDAIWVPQLSGLREI